MPQTVVEKVQATKFFVKKSPETSKMKYDKTIQGYWRSMYSLLPKKWYHLSATPSTYLCPIVFRTVFAKFLTFFKFSKIFRSFWTCLDLFGPVRMHWDAFRCVWKQLGGLGNFLFWGSFLDTFLDVLEVFGGPIDIFRTLGTFSKTSDR